MRETNGLRLRMLGGYSMTYMGNEILFGKGSPSLFQQLLFLLLLHKDSGISKEQLIELFYGWNEVGNKNNSLNNLIYRLRKRLVAAGFPEEDYVTVHNGMCCWSGSIPVWVDALELEQEYERGVKSENEQEKAEAFRRVQELYRGELLPQLATESWVIVESARMKKMYEASVRGLGVILQKREEYQRMYEVYSNAAELYPLDEWQTGQMEGLMAMECYEDAYRLYNNTVKRYTQELGMASSGKFLDYLQKLRGLMLLPETSLGRIREKLSEKQNEGVYYCAYPSFVDIYHVLCRQSERNGQSIFLMSCILRQFDDNKEKKNSDKVLELLRASICTSLRRGDLCTRYSKNQYLILLTGMRQENGEVITARIRKKFEQNQAAEGYALSFGLVNALGYW